MEGGWHKPNRALGRPARSVFEGSRHCPAQCPRSPPWAPTCSPAAVGQLLQREWGAQPVSQLLDPLPCREQHCIAFSLHHITFLFFSCSASPLYSMPSHSLALHAPAAKKLHPPAHPAQVAAGMFWWITTDLLLLLCLLLQLGCGLQCLRRGRAHHAAHGGQGVRGTGPDCQAEPRAAAATRRKPATAACAAAAAA